MSELEGAEDTRRHGPERLAAAALLLFVALQLTYLFLLEGASSPPAFDGPTDQLQAYFRENAVSLRTLPLIAVFNFVFLFVPGAVGLRRRLARSTPDGDLGPELVLPAAFLIMVSVFLGAAGYAVFALLPTDLWSGATLVGLIRLQEYCVFDLGGLAVALFAGATSLGILRSERAWRWLGYWGLATAVASIVSALWIVTADFHGPLYVLCMVARASFLFWIAAAGAWLLRTA